jgi:hypothetical protein
MPRIIHAQPGMPAWLPPLRRACDLPRLTATSVVVLVVRFLPRMQVAHATVLI